MQITYSCNLDRSENLRIRESKNQRIRMREESENQRISSRIRESHACILRVCSKKISGGLILHASGTVHCTGLRIPRGLQLYSYHARTAVVAHLRLHGGGGSPHAACRMRGRSIPQSIQGGQISESKRLNPTPWERARILCEDDAAGSLR